MFGCSSERMAQYHYKKALKHGLKLVQDSDTIRIATVDSIAVIRYDTIPFTLKRLFVTAIRLCFFKNTCIFQKRNGKQGLNIDTKRNWSNKTY
jgi:hypothetical protein